MDNRNGFYTQKGYELHNTDDLTASMEDYLGCKVSFLKQCENVVLYSDTRYFDTIYDAVRDKHVVVYGSRESVEKLMSSKDDFFEKDTE